MNYSNCISDPPGLPEISGYSGGQVVKTGDTMKLICVSRGGNPLAQVFWYRNNEELDFSYNSGNNRAENELIFTVQPQDNNAIYKCQASNSMTKEPLTTEVKLTVQCEFNVDRIMLCINSVLDLSGNPLWVLQPPGFN